MAASTSLLSLSFFPFFSLFFFLSSLSFASATRPGLVSSSVWYTNQTVLNTNYELGVVRMEFNQSLYVNGWTYLCSSAAKECPKLACRACDWSTPQVWMSKRERKRNFGIFLIFLCFLFSQAVVLTPHVVALCKKANHQVPSMSGVTQQSLSKL